MLGYLLGLLTIWIGTMLSYPISLEFNIHPLWVQGIFLAICLGILFYKLNDVRTPMSQ